MGSHDAAAEGQPLSRERWRTWAAIARRWLWSGVLVVVFVALFAAVRYVRDTRQPVYLATQTLMVSALAPSGGGAWGGAAADHAAAQVTVAYGGSTALSSTQARRAIAAHAQADQALAQARFGASGARAAQGLNAQASGAIVVAHSGVRISVTARASSAAGAWLLATAAGQTLADEAAQSPAAADAASQGITLRALLDGAASAPVRDPAPVASARARLVETLLLGLAGGLLLLAAVSVWDARAGGMTGAPEEAARGAPTAAAAGGDA